MLGPKRKRNSTSIETLVGRNTTLRGDIHFTGGLHIDGTIEGNVIADEDASSALSLSEHGCIKGEVRVPNITLNGKVRGNVHASHNIELASHASVTGNVFYNLIEMAMGAEVNGKLVHVSEAEFAKAKPAVKPVPVEAAPAAEKKLAGDS